MIIFPRSGCFWSDWTFFGWTKVKEKKKEKTLVLPQGNPTERTNIGEINKYNPPADDWK
jgi:hypothetical protein